MRRTDVRMHGRTAQRVAPRAIAALAAAIAAGAILLAAPPQAFAVNLDKTERAVVNQINKHRKAKGLPAVRLDVKLTRAAEWMSADMARKDYFSHTDSLGRDPFQRIQSFGYPSGDTWRGENLAAGNAAAGDTFLQWKGSPGHNANMLHDKFRAIGVARVYSSGSTYGWYWTTTFGSKVVKAVAKPKAKQKKGSKAKFAARRAKYSAWQRKKIRKTSRHCKRLQARKSRLGSTAYKRKFRAKQCGKYVRLGRKLGYIK